jgi:hypothetical protein
MTILLRLVALLPLLLAVIHHGLDSIELLGRFRKLTKFDRRCIVQARKRKTPGRILAHLGLTVVNLIVHGAKCHGNKETDQHEAGVKFGHDYQNQKALTLSQTRPL